jgi:hypothetical protein
MSFDRDPREREENLILCFIGAIFFAALVILYLLGDF